MYGITVDALIERLMALREEDANVGNRLVVIDYDFRWLTIRHEDASVALKDSDDDWGKVVIIEVER